MDIALVRAWSKFVFFCFYLICETWMPKKNERERKLRPKKTERVLVPCRCYRNHWKEQIYTCWMSFNFYLKFDLLEKQKKLPSFWSIQNCWQQSEMKKCIDRTRFFFTFKWKWSVLLQVCNPSKTKCLTLTSINSNFSMIPICWLLTVDSKKYFLHFGALAADMLFFS